MENEPVAPHSVAAEKAALGAVLMWPTLLERMVSSLDIDDFFVPAHRLIFEAMVDGLWKPGHPCDPVILESVLISRDQVKAAGGLDYLMDLAGSVPCSGNIDHYVRVIKEKAHLRRIIAVCAMVQSRAYMDSADHDGFVQESREALLKEVGE